MRGRLLPRLLVLVIVAVTGLGVVRPSWACGCGALITSTESGVSVAQETLIVRYDGAREEIVMRLSVRSRARDAAWLMPTPSRATVALGESAWSDQLDRLTAPRVVRHWHFFPHVGGAGDSAGAPAPGRTGGVGMLDRQRLGPFEVTTYAGRVTPAGVSSSSLRSMVGNGVFMTELVRQGIPPSDFTGDLGLNYIADAPYQEVDEEDGGLVTFLGVPAFLWLLLFPVVLVVAAVVVAFRPARRSARVRRGSATASP